MARPSSPRPRPFRLQDPLTPHARKASYFPRQRDAVIQESPNEELVEESLPFSTRYMNMLLQLDTISIFHNILAAASTWLLLAGFVFLPGTFTSIANSHTLQTGVGNARTTMVKAAQNLPLLGIAAVCCGVGLIGMSYL
jgi:hypothetical protein